MPGTRIRPLGVMILALLREGDMHPYEMIRLLKERHDDRLVTLQNGTFYHQVASLVRDGFIAEVGVDRDGNRPERTTYTILDDGSDAIAAWVRSRLGRVDKPTDFRVALAEAHNLERAEVVTLLRQRVAALQTIHDFQRTGLDAALAESIDPQFMIEAQRDNALILADIAWTQTLCDTIADPAYAWGLPSDEHRQAKHDRRKEGDA